MPSHSQEQGRDDRNEQKPPRSPAGHVRDDKRRHAQETNGYAPSQGQMAGEQLRNDRRPRPSNSDVRDGSHGQQQPREDMRHRPPVVQQENINVNSAPPIPSGYNLTNDAFDEGPVELVMCQGCGRKFKPEALERHAKICKQVFQQKRKAFDSAANRLGDLENADRLIQNAKKIEKEVQQKQDGDRICPEAAPSGREKPVPAWKKKSLEFRAAMLASKAMTGDREAQEKEQQVKAELTAMGGNEPADDPTKTVCPHCGRSFNKESAQKHIDICLKMFGGKKGGGGRLVRGGGRNCNSTAVAQAAQVPTAARNETLAHGRRTSKGNDASRGGSHGPPPMPGGRGDQPPSRER